MAVGNLLLLEKLSDVNRDFCNSGLSLICEQSEKDTLHVLPSEVVDKALGQMGQDACLYAHGSI